MSDEFFLKIPKFVGTPLSFIYHTIFFIGIFALRFFGVKYDDIMLILTTVVSLEAIYLSIFIQMTVNRHEAKLDLVEENMQEMQDNIEEKLEDIEDLVEDEQSTPQEEY